MAAVNSVQARPELRQPVHGNEELCLIQAVESRQIKNSSLEELKDVLRLVMVKIGLRSQNWPDENEKGVLISHVLTNYSNHTCDEIKLAFDMAIGGKLNFGKDESANCYENFSCLYFSSIMNAYKKWAAQVQVYMNNRPQINQFQKIYSDEEILNERRGDIETAFQTMRTGRIPIVHVYFEEVLREDGLLNESENVSEFFVRKLNNQSENIYKKS